MHCILCAVEGFLLGRLVGRDAGGRLYRQGMTEHCDEHGVGTRGLRDGDVQPLCLTRGYCGTSTLGLEYESATGASFRPDFPTLIAPRPKAQRPKAQRQRAQ
jgi:hypothetical protein